jgi:hypothetical protein
MKKSGLIWALLSLGLMAVPMTTAWASIVGDSVEVTFYYPDTSTIDGGPQTSTIVSGGTSFPVIYALNIVINGTTITITPTGSLNFSTFLVSSFNGYKIEDLSENLPTYNIINVTDMAGFSAANVSESGNTMFINFSGLPISRDTSITLASVPEIGTWAMMLAGFAGLAFAGYRRTRRGAPVAG